MSQNQDESILVKFEEALADLSLASSTIVNYLADLRAFLRWGKSKNGERFSLCQVNQEHIRLYRHHLAYELNRATSTVNRHLMSLRKFFTFARERGEIPINPMSGVALIHHDEEIHTPALSQDDLENLLAAAHHRTRAGLARRDAAILHLLLYTGLRVSEIVNLRKDDLIFDNPGVRLRVYDDSQAKTRYLPISTPLCKILNSYLSVRPKRSTTVQFFLNQRGQPISNRTVQRIVTDCAKTIGLKGISPQILRRIFALNLYQETENLELVCQRLGHQNKFITAQYLAIHRDK